MRKSLAVALLAVLFVVYPAAAQQPPGLAAGSPADGASATAVPSPAPPGTAAGSSGEGEWTRSPPVMSSPGAAPGSVSSLRDENALLKRKVDVLERQVELLRERVRSLEGGQ